MARFDVYQTSDTTYVLDVQTDLLSGLNTRVVVPLLPLENAPKPASHLNPIFSIKDKSLVMATQFLAAIPEAELRSRITSLRDHHQTISDALDLLFVGF